MGQPSDLPGDREVTILRTDAGLEFVRTPDERFEGLSGYVTIDGLRMHYVDEGPADGQVVLLLHGDRVGHTSTAR